MFHINVCNLAQLQMKDVLNSENMKTVWLMAYLNSRIQYPIVYIDLTHFTTDFIIA